MREYEWTNRKWLSRKDKKGTLYPFRGRDSSVFSWTWDSCTMLGGSMTWLFSVFGDQYSLRRFAWVDKGWAMVALWCGHLARPYHTFQYFFSVCFWLGWGIAEFLTGDWRGNEAAVILCPHWSAGSSHWWETVARSAIAHLPLGLPSDSSTLGPVWVFSSTRKGLDFFRKTTQSRSEAIRAHIGFILFSWPLAFFWCMGSGLLLLYFTSIFSPSQATLWPPKLQHQTQS